MTTGKTITLTRRTFVGKVMSLLLKMLSRLVITFLPRSKRLLISLLQSLSAVILGPPKIKSATVSIVSPSIWHEVMGPGSMILIFWMLSFKSTFSLSSFIKRLFSSFAFCHKGGVICISEVINIHFCGTLQSWIRLDKLIVGGWQRMRWLDGIAQTWVWAILGDGEGQQSLACCSPWGCKESEMT